MKPDFSNGVPPEVLRRIRGEQDEVKGMESKSYFCPYCNHKTVVVYQDAHGHIQPQCKRCGKEAIYNVSFRIAGTYYLTLRTTPPVY